MTGVFPVVKGVRLRATKMNNCGLPVPGPRNRVVTDGFITYTLTPVMRDAAELEQANAEGRICVADRTPPTRKWYTLEMVLCNVNTGLITLLNGWPQVLDYADVPIGFDDSPDVDSDFGVMVEVWTGGKGEDDCPPQTTDTIFSAPTSGRSYGYFLAGAVEFTLGPIEIGESVSTFTLSGLTVAAPHWGRGPYNVSALDSAGTPGRMLVPMGQENHYRVFRTPVAPPDVTATGDPQPLDILGKFVDPDFYFGGPGNAPAADVAPDQDEATVQTITITGGPPTGGDFELVVTYPDTSTETVTVPWNSAAAAVKTLLVAPDDGYVAADWTTTGGPLPGTPVVVTPPIGVSLAVGANNLTPSGTVVVS